MAYAYAVAYAGFSSYTKGSHKNCDARLRLLSCFILSKESIIALYELSKDSAIGLIK